MSTAYFSRVLQILCQPLQGMYSSGTALVRATSATTALGPGDVLIPTLRGCESEESAVKVERNPAAADGAWTVAATGTAVAVTSLQGGNHVNLPAGTQLRFDNAPAGISGLAEVETALTGGTRLEAFGALRQVRSYKDLGSQIDAKSFFSAQIGDYPAAVLTWDATTPGDGSVSPSIGVDQTRVGRGRRIYCHEWNWFIISSRLDSSDRRKREGDVIRDRLLRLLTDRTKWRGVPLSNSHGIKVTDARLAAAGPTAYIDVIRFCNWFVLDRTEEREFHDWLATHLEISRPTSAGELLTVDIDVPIPGHG